MKNKIFTLFAAAILSISAASAQALTGTYFLDNSLMKNRLNPAFTPRANYFGIPAISNFGVGMYGNVGASTFLYPKNGQLYTFPNQSGDMKLEFNAEYRFRMFWKVEGAVFADIGNIWSLRRKAEIDDTGIFTFKNFGKSIAADWGAGVRLNLGFLLLRVDLGMKVHDPSRSQAWVNPGQWLKKGNYTLHFGVGYPF